MSRTTDLAKLLELLRDANAPRRLVVIDGLGGAGKSTLARSLAQRIEGSIVVEIDSFHLPAAEAAHVVQTEFGDLLDLQRLEAEVITPFREGADSIAYHRYNWGYLCGEDDRVDPTPHVVPTGPLLIVEGCGSFRIRTHPTDTRIWADAAAELCLERGMRRDIEEYGLDPDDVSSLWRDWTKREETRSAKYGIDSADVIFETG